MAPPGEGAQPDAASWEALRVLAEPTRRAVFETVRAARGPVTRDEVAAELGLQRTLAAFHLDRLADARLVQVTYARTGGRSGRGAGRPAKRYDASQVSVAVSVPGRQHELAGRLLARAIAEQPTRADQRAGELAEEEGRRLGGVRRSGKRLNVDVTLQAAAQALSDLGYEPERAGDSVRLRNCPFHGLVEEAADLVCSMNARLIAGLLSGLGGSRQVGATLDPTPGQCCVTVGRSRRSSGRDTRV